MDASFLTTWGTAIGIFFLTGTFMQAMNMTIGGKAGDKGFKGFYYTWKRFLLVLIGGALGACAPLLGLSSPIGEGIGAGLIDGIVAAWAASGMYDLVVGSIKARVRHKLARKSQPPPAA
jgi:hypothetical protein